MEKGGLWGEGFSTFKIGFWKFLFLLGTSV